MMVAAGLQAALQLARGRPEAVLLVGGGEEGMTAARRSFWAAAICTPAFVGLHLLEHRGAAGPGLRALAIDILGFAIGWIGFALASHRVAGMLGRAVLWPRFITLWNWCNLLQYLMLTAAALSALVGLPDWIGQTAWLVALGWAMWLEWFMTRVSLALSGAVAVAMVALDVAIGLLVAGGVGSPG